MINLDEIAKLQQSFSDLISKIKPENLQAKLSRLESQTSRSDFWANEEKAKRITQKISFIQTKLDQLETLKQKLSEIKAAVELLSNQPDQTLKIELQQNLKTVTKLLKELETDTYLSGKYDHRQAILALHAGQGGTEAMDWNSMLFRMYSRYFEKKDWPFQIIDQSPGEEAGLKSITLIVNAPFAYGYLKNEAGVHRLVRLSPFNADNLRQTSFAGVEVTPVFAKTGPITIKDEEIEFEAFKASGAGGQNVNKVNSAVRLKHKPTAITVTCQSQRHQEQNRQVALQLLQARLWQIEQEKRLKQLSSVKGEHKLPGWGNQIRSYVLHPYKQVKDLRTKFTSSKPEAVLAGDLNGFIAAELKYFA